MTDKATIDILSRLTDNQIQTSNIIKKLDTTIVEINSMISNLSSNIEVNTDEVGAFSHVMEGMKALIADFSVYAAQREELDKVIKDNIEITGTVLQGVLDMYTESNVILGGIHAYTQEIAEKRTHILSSMNSERYNGLNMLQEWLFDLFAEMVSKFSYKEVTYIEVVDWLKQHIATDKFTNGNHKMPQYSNLKDRIKLSENLMDAVKERFNITGVVEISMWSNLMVFHSMLEGSKFIDYPKLGYIKEKIKFLEDKFYE